MIKKISDIVADFLVEKGLSQIFGVTGGGAMHLNDSFDKHKKLKFTYMHHEQSAAMAADAYYRENSKPAIIHTTSGPGSTNALTGVVGAWIDSIPAIIISGQVPSKQQINKSKTRQIGIQEADTINIMRSSTKYISLIKNPNKVIDELEKAYEKMLDGKPGPVWIDIPLDMQASKIKFDKIKNRKKKIKKKNLDISYKIKEMYNLINISKRPVVIAGNGIHLSRTKKEFYKLIEKLNLPVITSWNASDLMNTRSNNYIGRMGIFGDRASNFAAQNSDLMIVLGSRLSIPQIGYETKKFAKDSKKIIVDIDESELNKNLLSNVKIKFNCHLSYFFSKANKTLTKKSSSKFSNWQKLILRWKKKFPVVQRESFYKGKLINSFFFIKKLSKVLKNNTTVVTDMGTSFTCTMQTMEINNHKNQRLFTSSGLASMGFGLPGSIGASFANPKKKIICVTGDGGLMFNIQELQTIVHYNLPIKIFVLENKGYLTMQLMQKKNFKKFTGSDPKSGITFPATKNIAGGFGIKYLKLKKEKIENQLIKIMSNRKPMIIEVNMPKFQPLIPRVQAQLLKDGSFLNPEFDNLYPHLPEKVLMNERDKAKKLFN